MIFAGIYNGEEVQDWLHSPLAAIYGLFMMIWITCFNESWSRKENSIANLWLVRDLKHVNIERVDWKNEETVDPDTLHTIKRATLRAYKRQLCIGLPFSLLFVSLIFAAQVMFRFIERDMHQGQDVAWYMHYVPGITNALLILIFGSIYKRIAAKLV